MVFSNFVKEEFLGDYYTSECCNVAFLSAIIHTSGSINITGGKIFLEIISKNEKFLERCKKEFNNKYNTVCSIEKTGGGLFSLKADKEKSLSILNDTSVLEYDEEKSLQLVEGVSKYLIENECCKKAYLKGAFLGGGIITVPAKKGSGYQLEFVLSNETLANDILKLLAGYNLAGHINKRKNSFIVYLKNSEIISDFLALMSASKSVIELQNLILERQVSNMSNRQNNCLIANTIKNFDAAINQVYSISLIEKYLKLSSLNSTLRQAAELRLDNPESSIEELARLAGITKSGMNHRLRKINEIADEIKTRYKI